MKINFKFLAANLKKNIIKNLYKFIILKNKKQIVKIYFSNFILLVKISKTHILIRTLFEIKFISLILIFYRKKISLNKQNII